MEYLAKKLDLDINPGLSDVEKSISRGLRFLVEGDWYWAGKQYRWVILKGMYLPTIYRLNYPDFVIKYVLLPLKSWEFSKDTYHQGIGRHSPSEVKEMAFKDIESISIYLGQKEYMFGNVPTEIDCVVFGMVSMVLHCHPKNSIFHLKITNEHPNLVDFAERMKQNFWPDWENCLDKIRTC